MILNNELTDFAFVPVDPNGAPAANAAGPGKAPRSSMSPTIVLDADGAPRVMSLRDVLRAFLDHRRECLVRRTNRRLEKIADRLEENAEAFAVAETWCNGKGVRETIGADIPLAVDERGVCSGAGRDGDGPGACCAVLDAEEAVTSVS